MKSTLQKRNFSLQISFANVFLVELLSKYPIKEVIDYIKIVNLMSISKLFILQEFLNLTFCAHTKMIC